MNLKNTITYHARAQYHRKKSGSLEEAFNLTENYENYFSFYEEISNEELVSVA